MPLLLAAPEDELRDTDEDVRLPKVDPDDPDDVDGPVTGFLLADCAPSPRFLAPDQGIFIFDNNTHSKRQQLQLLKLLILLKFLLS